MICAGTVVGLGASLSASLTGFIAQHNGFRTAFLVLAAIAVGATALLATIRETGPGSHGGGGGGSGGRGGRR